MRRVLLVSSLLAGLVAFGSMPAQAAISANINIHVGDRSPRVYYERAPRGYLIPSSDVYYYGDSGYDMYRCDGLWYVNDGGYWYESRSWRGPFIGIRFESVPSRIFRVPARYHRESRGWSSSRQVWNDSPRYRDRGRYDNRDWNRNDRGWNRNDRRDDNDNDQGNGRGHRRGRGHGNGNGNRNGNGNDNGDGRWNGND